MDETERKSKLLAGKDALLAYQKKKARKSKKKCSSSLASSSFGSLASDTSLDESTSLPSVPVCNVNSGLVQSSLSLTKTAQGVDQSRPQEQSSDSDHCLPVTDSGVIADAPLTQSNSLPSNGINGRSLTNHTYSSLPISNGLGPDNGHLQQQLLALQKENQQLVTELDDVKENHRISLEESNQKLRENYSKQITTLQQSLLESESALQTKEKEVIDQRAAHLNEIQKLQEQELVSREALLKEKDEKHASHVARLTEQLSSQENIAGHASQEEAEEEARRIQQLKEKMIEIHEQEKEKILLSHQEEKQILLQEHIKQKESLHSEYQQTLDRDKRRLEESANAQIKSMHNQYTAAYQSVVAEKDKLASVVSSSNEELMRLNEMVERLQLEKTETENMLKQSREAHSEEMLAIHRTSQENEARLKSWQLKAANLEARHEGAMKEKLQEEYEVKLQEKASALQELEERLMKMEVEHSDTLARLNQAHEEGLNKTQAEYAVTISELKKEHEIEVKALQMQHLDEVSNLEDSITEQANSQASLEFAEVHMKELQQQLNAYRNQGASHQAQIETMTQQHHENIASIREQLTTEKNEEIESVRCELTDIIQEKEMEVATLKQQHNQELEALQEASDDLKDKLGKDKKELEASHAAALESIAQQHSIQLEKVQQKTREECQSEAASELEIVRTELAAEKKAELNQLTAEHSAALERIRNEIASTGEEALPEAKAKIVELENKLREAEVNQRETRRLQEQCQKYQTELTARQVDLSIAQSALNKESVSLKRVQEENQGLVEKLGTLESALQEAQDTHSQEMESLEDEVTKQNDLMATLQNQVAALTEQCEQERKNTETAEQQQLTVMAEKDQEINRLRQKYSQQLESLRNERDGMQERLLSDHDASIKGEREQLEESHAAELEDIVRQHSAQLKQVQQRTREECQSQMNLEIKRIQEEMARQRNTELEQVRLDHKEALDKIRSELVVSGEETLKEAKVKIFDLETKLRDMTAVAHKLGIVEEENQSLQLKVSELESALHQAENDRTAEMKQEELITGQRELISGLETQVTSLKQEREAMQAQLEQHSNRTSELESQLSSLQASTSDEVSTLRQAVTEKEAALSSMQTRLDATSQQLYAQQQAITESESLSSQNIEELTAQLRSTQQQLSLVVSDKEEQSAISTSLQQQLEDLQQASSLTASGELKQAHDTISTLTANNHKQSQDIASLQQHVREIEEELASAGDEKEKACKEKKATVEQLSEAMSLVQQLQAEHDAVKRSSDGVQRSMADLQQQHNGVCKERDDLLGQVTALKEAQHRNDVLKAESEGDLRQTVEKQVTIISELKAQLTVQKDAFAQTTKEFQKQLSDAENKHQSLLAQIKDSRHVQDRLTSLVGDRSKLEKTLSQSRQALLDKLREKQLLEKDLNYHRTELQRRLLEKQRVEELLFEKARFEKELKKQKENLKIELDSIEKKLVLREVQANKEHSFLSDNSGSFLSTRDMDAQLRKTTHHRKQDVST